VLAVDGAMINRSPKPISVNSSYPVEVWVELVGYDDLLSGSGGGRFVLEIDAVAEGTALLDVAFRAEAGRAGEGLGSTA